MLMWKRLQIMIDEDLDVALGRAARRAHRSKAALIRQFVRRELQGEGAANDDPLFTMLGRDEFEPKAVDEVVYR